MARVVFPYKSLWFSMAVAIATFDIYSWKFTVWYLIFIRFFAFANSIFPKRIVLGFTESWKCGPLKDSQKRGNQILYTNTCSRCVRMNYCKKFIINNSTTCYVFMVFIFSANEPSHPGERYNKETANMACFTVPRLVANTILIGAYSHSRVE